MPDLTTDALLALEEWLRDEATYNATLGNTITGYKLAVSAEIVKEKRERTADADANFAERTGSIPRLGRADLPV